MIVYYVNLHSCILAALTNSYLTNFIHLPPPPFHFPPQFNDILIYASSIPPANTTYKVIKRIPLDGMQVEHLDDPEMRYGFQIISTCKSFRLEARLGDKRIYYSMHTHTIVYYSSTSLLIKTSLQCPG